MTRLARAAALAALTAAVSLPIGPALAKSCVKAGGTATMITEDLARFMAEAALKNSISGGGMKGEGKVSMTCKPESGLVNCTASQKACK